uniref:UBX domain-containing protein 11-like n=1 Tax=Ciona intestinalis TaxID=7719 RepID=UPI00006A4819|nr:UBX domain-containing protein 11-like [Ciona intestinalis]|eukprot:XP_002132128.1 UBX domain-containing protein 11-like [Ciona intestinalis]
MSSPLNILSKHKKHGLNNARNFGKRPMPFRTPDLGSEDSLLNDVTSSMVSPNSYLNSFSSVTSSYDSTVEGITPRKLLQASQRASPMLNPIGNVGHSNKKAMPQAPNDMELLSTMMKRITQLEKQVAFYSKEVVEKDTRIKILEDKLALFKNKESKESDEPGKVAQLEMKCLQLQQEIYEMEAFLADYGMIWVGEKSNPNSKEYLENDDDSVPVATVTDGSWAQDPPPENFKVDYDLVLRNIQELNIIAGDGQADIVKTKGGAKLQAQKTVPLILYANGIMLFNGPFRPLSDVTTQRCLCDITDGYFPSELQERYPDGVPIQVTDKRHIKFKDARKAEIFPGVGRSLLDKDNIAKTSTQILHKEDLVSKQTNTGTSSPDDLEESSELPGLRMSVEQFLDKVPKSVIRGGKVVDIRSSLKESLTDSTRGKVTTEIVETEAVKNMQHRMEIPQQERPVSARDVTTIRVKSEDGSKIFILKLKFSDTIQDLRNYIKKQRPRHREPYDILSTFPNQKHSDLKKTMQDSGLVPNATLFLKRK